MKRTDLVKVRKNMAHVTRQAGQAMTEVLIASLMLVPVFLMIPLLGKYIDMNQATYSAARYAAWERTVWFDRVPGSAASAGISAATKSDAQVEQETKQRFFSSPAAPVIVQGSTSANPLWKDHAGNRLVSVDKGVHGTLSNQKTPGVVYGAFADLAKPLKGVLGNFDPRTDGLYTAKVKLAVTDVKSLEPFDKLGLNIERSNTILVDGWDAGAPAHVVKRAESLVPTHIFDKPLIDNIIKVVKVVFPEIQGLELGYVAPDAVPNDRLANPK